MHVLLVDNFTLLVHIDIGFVIALPSRVCKKDKMSALS